MKSLILVTTALIGVVFVAFAYAEKEGSATTVKGVAGNLIRIEKNKQSADTEDQVVAHVGDRVEIDWTYPVAPPFPDNTSAKSDDPCVRFAEIRTIQRVNGPIGVGMLGAFFTAESEGTATLTFVIDSGGQGVILKVKVTVKK
jgi:hypothetical protein